MSVTVSAGRRTLRKEPSGVAGWFGAAAATGSGWLAAAVGCYLGLLLADRSRIVVRGPSMAPTLLPGDVVLSVPLPGAMRSLASPGRVVLIADPADARHTVIKRVIARHGDELWLEGDDHARSTDSRRWGWVPRSRVRRLVVRRWPQVRTPLWRAPRPQIGQRWATTSTSGSSRATSPGARRP